MNTTTKQMLEHKSYIGTIEVDIESGLLHGMVQGINDVVHYEATTVDKLLTAFRESVDDYLAMCQASDESPDKPYSGKFQARIGEELHRKAASIATVEGVSLNDFVVAAIEDRVASRTRPNDTVAGVMGFKPSPRRAVA